jgi:hypothetical protein
MNWIQKWYLQKKASPIPSKISLFFPQNQLQTKPQYYYSLLQRKSPRELKNLISIYMSFFHSTKRRISLKKYYSFKLYIVNWKLKKNNVLKISTYIYKLLLIKEKHYCKVLESFRKITKINLLAMEQSLRNPKKYAKTLFELEKFHQITFFINEKQRKHTEALKKLITLSFDKYSANDEVQIIFTINKLLGIFEFQSRRKHAIDNQDMDLIHYEKLFSKRQLKI